MACGPPDNPGETEEGCQAWLTRSKAARRAEWSWSTGDEVSHPNDGLFASKKLVSGKVISEEQLEEFTLNRPTCLTEQGAPACPVWCQMGYSSQSRTKPETLLSNPATRPGPAQPGEKVLGVREGGAGASGHMPGQSLMRSHKDRSQES